MDEFLRRLLAAKSFILTGRIPIVGRVRAVTTDLDGKVLSDTGWSRNQYTYHGASALVSWLAGQNNTGYNPPYPPPSYMEMGTGTGTPAPTDTALYAPIPATFQQCSAITVVAGTPNLAQFVTVYGPSAPAFTATEAGLFDLNSAMFAHLASLNIQHSTGTNTSVAWQLQPTV